MSFGTVVDIVGGVKLNEPRLEASSFQSVDRVDQLHLEILVLVLVIHWKTGGRSEENTLISSCSMLHLIEKITNNARVSCLLELGKILPA